MGHTVEVDLKSDSRSLPNTTVKMDSENKVVLSYFICFIVKGLWLEITTLTNPAFGECVEAFQPKVESLGGSVLQRYGGRDSLRKRGKLGVMIEFPSIQAGIYGFDSYKYQELCKFNVSWANSIVININRIDCRITH